MQRSCSKLVTAHSSTNSRSTISWRKKFLPSSLLLLWTLLSLLSFTSSLQAENIYKWTDDEGQVHYSTTPVPGKANKADLPRLQKENIDDKIKRIKSETPPNCESHGGIDCSQGADADGSVICLDGYRGALLPFRFRCAEARLKHEFLLFYKGSENPIAHSRHVARQNRKRELHEVQINVRNNSEVEAIGMKVRLYIPGVRTKEVLLPGPEKVEPYGLADYTMRFDAESELTPYQIGGLKVKVRCENCR